MGKQREMTLNDQICGTNGDSRIHVDLGDEIRTAEERIKDRDRQIQKNRQRMEAKRKDWESENARLSRQVLFTVFGLVSAAMLAYWYWA